MNVSSELMSELKNVPRGIVLARCRIKFGFGEFFLCRGAQVP